MNSQYADHLWILTDKLCADEIDFYTDASRAETLGMGGVFQDNWFFTQWENGYIEHCQPSISYLELLALTTGIILWAKHLRNKRVVVFAITKLLST